MRTFLTFLRRGLVAVAAAIAFWTVVLMVFEERFVYFPVRFPAGAYEDARLVPGLQEHIVRTPDGIRLHAWYAPADSPYAVILYSHGNGGNMSYDIERIRRLQRSGLSVFAFDYRGYGKSEGRPTEAGVVSDAIAAYDHLRDSLGIPARRVILWGSSLGGAVTVQLAARRPAAGLVLESTFPSARAVAERHYPFLPVRWLMRTSFRSADTLHTLDRPSLHLHGDRDDIIEQDLGRELYEAAAGPKEWYSIAGAGHNDTFIVGGEAYLSLVAAFIRRHVSPKANLLASNPV